MDTTNYLGSALLGYSQQLPLVLVWISGIMLAILWRRRYPRVALLVILASLIFMLVDFANISFYMWLPLIMIRTGLPTDRMLQFGMLVTLFGSALKAGAWILLLIAAFSGRKQRLPRLVDSPKVVPEP